MKARKSFHYTPVDCLYFFILTMAIAAGTTAAGSVLREQEFLVAFLESDIFVYYSEIGLGLAPFFFSLLAWRIVMASRYRPYATLADTLLPRITVVIPAFNEGEQVLSTIRSVMINSDASIVAPLIFSYVLGW